MLPFFLPYHGGDRNNKVRGSDSRYRHTPFNFIIMKTKFDWTALIIAVSFFAALFMCCITRLFYQISLAALALIAVYGFMGLISKLERP